MVHTAPPSELPPVAFLAFYHNIFERGETRVQNRPAEMLLCYSSAFGRTVTASGHSNRSTRFIVQRWAGCFLAIRFRTVCAVNAQT